MSRIRISQVFCLGFALLFCFMKSVDGIQCYNCLNTGDNENDKDSCTGKISAGEATECPSHLPYCLKSSGFVNGKAVSLRNCAESNWKLIMDGSNKCVESKTLSNFKFNINQREVRLDDGIVCICDGNKCNPANSLLPSIFGIVSIGIVGISSRFLI